MEHVEGYNLKEIIQIQKGKKFEESVICGFITQLVSSLNYLNDLGVAHRDLKAENVKITKDGLLKLLDFGQAKDDLWSGKSWHTRKVGTITYNAPEQFDALIADRGIATYQADLWSLGVLIYQLCALKLPFIDTDE